MPFRDDYRGQAIQIGAVLLLGALVLVFSIYQAAVVPEQNREIEFKHSQSVQDQMGEARNAFVSTAGTGEGRSVSIRLGTQYPSRLIALNPGPPSGVLATVGTANESITAMIANAAASGETGDFWNGTNRSYNTGAMVYRPGYNEYHRAPKTWYEHSVAFNEFPGVNQSLSGQQLIDGETVSLVTLNGSYYTSRSRAATLDVRALSTSTRRVQVTNATADSNVVISLPTRLSESDWRELLAEEIDTGHVVDVNTTAVPGADYQQLEVVLEQGVTYDLRLSRIGVGTNVARPGPAYLTDVSGNGTTVPEGGKTQLTVEVRDALDNPKAAVSAVAGTRWDNSSVMPVNATSDGDGQVTLTYEAPENISGASQRTDHVQVSLNTSLRTVVNGTAINGSTATNVTLAVRVDNSDGSGLDSGGGGTATLSAGQGGESTYSPSASTELLTDENGLWKRINKTDQVIFSDGYPIVDPQFSDEYVLSEFTIANASETFSVEMQAYRTTGGSYGGNVSIYRFGTDNQESLSLSSAAARDVLTGDRYNGTDVLNRANYASSDAAFTAYLRAIAEMDNSTTEVVFSDQDGRVNLTLQGESLFTMVKPNTTTANDEDEYVRLHFENATNASGWTIADTDDEDTLPAARLQGGYYFTKNETAFLDSHPSVAPARVYETSLRLADGGEALELRDQDGDLRDEFAYGAEQTSHGWNLSLGVGDVANRTTYADGVYVDTDSASDWTIETVDITGPSITGMTKPPDGTYTEGDVLSFDVSYDEAVVVSGTPALTLDIDGDADNESATYQSGSGTQTLTFNYTIQSSDNDTDGIAFASTNISSGTMADSAGNPADRNFTDVAPDLSGITVTSYAVTVDQAASAGGNSIDVTFTVSTNDPNAQVEVQSLRTNGNVRDSTGLLPVDSSQPQTENVNGANQVAEVRVIVYDGSGVEQDRDTVPYPYP